jgi:hypothetical protein
MKGGAKRLDLFKQVVGQLLAGTHRYCRDVVNGLVRVQLDALATGVGQRVDHMGLDFEQAKFKHLKQPDRAGTDDDCIGFDRILMVAHRGYFFFLQMGTFRVRSAKQVGQLAGLVFPLFCLGQCGLAFGNAFPGGQLGQLGVELGHVLLVGGYIFFCVDRIDRTFGNADGAVNALIGVDGQEVGAFAEAVHGANVDAIGVFAFDTGFGDGMCHVEYFDEWVETLYFIRVSKALLKFEWLKATHGLDGIN